MRFGPLKVKAKARSWEFTLYGGYLRTVKGKRQHRRIWVYSMYRWKDEEEIGAAERCLERLERHRSWCPYWVKVTPAQETEIMLAIAFRKIQENP